MGNDLSTIDRADWERFRDLLGRAIALQSAEVEELRALFAKHPDLWRATDYGRFGADFAPAAKAGGTVVNAVLQASLEGRIRALSRLQDGTFERLLVEHVALCLVRLQWVESNYNRVMSREHALSLGDHWEGRLSAAQRRFLRATEALARIRRLALPTLQVNIGEQQVNVASGGGGIGLPRAGDPPAAGPPADAP